MSINHGNCPLRHSFNGCERLRIAVVHGTILGDSIATVAPMCGWLILPATRLLLYVHSLLIYDWISHIGEVNLSCGCNVIVIAMSWQSSFVCEKIYIHTFIYLPLSRSSSSGLTAWFDFVTVLINYIISNKKMIEKRDWCCFPLHRSTFYNTRCSCSAGDCRRDCW